MTITNTSTIPTTGDVRNASRVRTERLGGNHNRPTTGLRVKSRVRADLSLNYTKIQMNHNQAAKGLRVKSRVRAGGIKLTDILVSG
jgi:hypothetical protein